MKKEVLVEKYKRKADNEINIHFMNLYNDVWSDQRFRLFAMHYLLKTGEFEDINKFKERRFSDYDGYQDWTREELLDEVNRSFPRSYILNFEEDFVVNLNSQINVPREESDFFPFFFSFRLWNKKVNEIKLFLEFHLEKTFQNDASDFIEFIEDIILMFEEEFTIRPKIVTKVNRWIESRKGALSGDKNSSGSTMLESHPHSTGNENKNHDDNRPNQSDKKLLTVKDVSEIMGVPVSSIYKMTSSGEIPHIKIGQSVRFIPEDFYQYLETKKIPTTSERMKGVGEFLSSKGRKKNN